MSTEQASPDLGRLIERTLDLLEIGPTKAAKVEVLTRLVEAALQARETPKPAFSSDYVRMWDLVRYARGYLSDEGLITAQEYVALASEETQGKPGQGSPAPRRLESYDELRAAVESLRQEKAQLEDEAREYASALAGQLQRVEQAEQTVLALQAENADWKFSFEASNEHVGKLEQTVRALQAENKELRKATS